MHLPKMGNLHMFWFLSIFFASIFLEKKLFWQGLYYFLINHIPSISSVLLNIKLSKQLMLICFRCRVTFMPTPFPSGEPGAGESPAARSILLLSGFLLGSTTLITCHLDLPIASSLASSTQSVSRLCSPPFSSPYLPPFLLSVCHLPQLPALCFTHFPSPPSSPPLL